MDNDLGRVAELVDHWAEIAQGGVPPPSIVELLDVVAHVRFQFFPRDISPLGRSAGRYAAQSTAIALLMHS